MHARAGVDKKGKAQLGVRGCSRIFALAQLHDDTEFHLFEPAVQPELLHAFAHEFSEETQAARAAQLALYAFARLWEVLLLRAVVMAGEVAGSFHTARERWLPPFADGFRSL
jgi:hypothetical protein